MTPSFRLEVFRESRGVPQREGELRLKETVQLSYFSSRPSRGETLKISTASVLPVCTLLLPQSSKKEPLLLGEVYFLGELRANEKNDVNTSR